MQQSDLNLVTGISGNAWLEGLDPYQPERRRRRKKRAKQKTEENQPTPDQNHLLDLIA